MYDEDLAMHLTKELGGAFETLVVNCLQGIEEDFDPEYHTEELVAQDGMCYLFMEQFRIHC